MSRSRWISWKLAWLIGLSVTLQCGAVILDALRNEDNFRLTANRAIQSGDVLYPFNNWPPAIFIVKYDRSLSSMKRYHSDDHFSAFNYTIRKESGFPFRWLGCNVYVFDPDHWLNARLVSDFKNVSIVSENCLWLQEPLPRDTLGFRCIPLGIMWKNTVISFAITMSALLLLSMAIKLAKKKRRAMQGKCTDCGYAAAGLAACPECGKTQG